MIGNAASAADISRDVAAVAKEVHVASRSITEGTVGKQPGYDNLWIHSMVKFLIHMKNWVAVIKTSIRNFYLTLTPEYI